MCVRESGVEGVREWNKARKVEEKKINLEITVAVLVTTEGIKK